MVLVLVLVLFLVLFLVLVLILDQVVHQSYQQGITHTCESIKETNNGVYLQSETHTLVPMVMVLVIMASRDSVNLQTL